MSDVLLPFPGVRSSVPRPAQADLHRWLSTFDPREDLASFEPLSPLSSWRIRREDFGALAFQASTGRLLRLDDERAAEEFAKQHPVTQFVSGRHIPNSLRAPVKLFFDITKLCNLKCSHCLSSSGQSVETLPARIIKSVLQQAYDLGVFQVKFGGGEPLLHPRFFETVNFANSRSMRVSISTNGVTVTKRRAALIAATGVKVSVSIDGDERVHDMIRGRHSYHRAVRGIERLLAAGAQPAIRMTLFNHPEANNLHLVEDVVGLGERYGIEVKLRRAKPAGRASDGDLPLAFPTEQYWALLDWLDDARKHGRKVEIEDLMCLSGDGTDKIFPTTFDCAAGTRSIHVDVYGDIGPCVFLGSSYLSGNVFVTPLDRVWHKGHGFNSTRDYAVQDNADCRGCGRNVLCSGECRAIVFYAQAATGQPADGSGKDPCCPREQRVYEFTNAGSGKWRPVQVRHRDRPRAARRAEAAPQMVAAAWRMGIRRSTGAIARSAEGVIFVVSPEHEWQARCGPAGQARAAPFGCVGGKLKPGELPADAVRREISEETINSRWTVTGRATRTSAFLPDGTEVAWEPRFGMPGAAASPDLVIIEDGLSTAQWLLYGFAATVSGDPRPHGGHPALLHVPWRLLPEFRPDGTAMTGADVLAGGGRIVPDRANDLLRGVPLFPIGTARFLCVMSRRSPAHPLLAELGLIAPADA